MLTDSYLALHNDSLHDSREFTNELLGTNYTQSRWNEFMRGDRTLPDPVYRLILAMVLGDKLRFFDLPELAIKEIIRSIEYKR